jgi:hypothetical protein
MNFFGFIASIIDSLAWPTAFAIAIFILRKELAQLLSRLKTIKHKDTEFGFSRGVTDAREKAERSLPALQVENTKPPTTSERLAELSPRGAVLESWLEVESALTRLAERYGIPSSELHLSNLEILRLQLSDYQPIGRGAFELLERLRKLRNEAVHLQEEEIDLTTAIEYSHLANRLVRIIDEA